AEICEGRWVFSGRDRLRRRCRNGGSRRGMNHQNKGNESNGNQHECHYTRLWDARRVCISQAHLWPRSWGGGAEEMFFPSAPLLPCSSAAQLCFRVSVAKTVDRLT